MSCDTRASGRIDNERFTDRSKRSAHRALNAVLALMGFGIVVELVFTIFHHW